MCRSKPHCGRVQHCLGNHNPQPPANVAGGPHLQANAACAPHTDHDRHLHGHHAVGVQPEWSHPLHAAPVRGACHPSQLPVHKLMPIPALIRLARPCRLMPTWQSDMHRFELVHFCKVCFAICSMKTSESDDLLQARIEEVVQDLEPLQITTILYSLGRLNHHPGIELMEALLSGIHLNIQAFAPQVLLAVRQRLYSDPVETCSHEHKTSPHLHSFTSAARSFCHQDSQLGFLESQQCCEVIA